jgi:hypothetical protein
MSLTYVNTFTHSDKVALYYIILSSVHPLTRAINFIKISSRNIHFIISTKELIKLSQTISQKILILSDQDKN